MDQFIELRFGQMFDVQREIIPVSSIESVYVELCEAKNIVFILRINGREYKRIEYYPTPFDCNKRWMQIREILTGKSPVGHPLPLELDKFIKFSAVSRNQIEKAIHRQENINGQEDEDE